MEKKQQKQNNNLNKMTTERKCSATYTDTAVLNFDGNTIGTNHFLLTCPFIPDRVEVQAAIGGFSLAGATIAPLNTYVIAAPVNNTPAMAGANIFLVQLSCIPSGRFVMANITNTFNPIFKFDNINGQYFQGSYTAQAWNSNGLITVNQINGGQVILYFTFYKD